jgi:glycerol-1-phosphate dehydrogenase [NAD(P)+]
MTRETMIQRFGEVAGAECWIEFERKRLSQEAADQLNERIVRNWDDLTRRSEAFRVPSSKVELALRRAGAPTHHKDIGVSAHDFAAAVSESRYLRDRFTFLDLADEAGRLEEIWLD